MKIVWKQEISYEQKITPQKIVDILIEGRKIDDIKTFLNPTDPTKIGLVTLDTSKDFLKKKKKVFELLHKIKEEKGMIVVYSDYDADGITGASILWETLHLLGFKTMPYVPDRKTEGYGFSIKGLDTIKEKYNPSLIISVDHGITAAEKITYAKKIGIPVIVTDHHLKPEILPDDAVAVFHIPALSGSGVAYYFAKEIYTSFQDDREIPELEHHFKNDYLFLASIGTIADLVPLVGPSRNLVYYGLKAALKTNRHGLLHIFKQSGIEGKAITPYEVGFIIAPRINAIGRLEHAMDALRLLCTTDSKRAEELAGKIGNTNTQRQGMVTDAVKEAKKQVEEQLAISHKLSKILILKSLTWHEGIIGLIASKITEEYYRPTIIMTKSDGFYKGSARSIPSFHITNFLRGLKKHLVDVGGHTGAAGFTIEEKKMEQFINAAMKQSEKLINDKDLERSIEADLKIPVSLVTLPLAKLIQSLAPFGIGNSQPTFVSDVELVEAKLLGKTGTHLKLFVKNVPSSLNPVLSSRATARDLSFPLELIMFGGGKKFKELSRGMKLQVVYKIDLNKWDGKEKLQGIVVTLN